MFDIRAVENPNSETPWARHWSGPYSRREDAQAIIGRLSQIYVNYAFVMVEHGQRGHFEAPAWGVADNDVLARLIEDGHREERASPEDAARTPPYAKAPGDRSGAV